MKSPHHWLAPAALALSALAGASTAHAGSVFTFTKSFGAASVPLNGSTSLTFNIQRFSTPASNINFTDPLPAGMVVASPNGLTGDCGVGSVVMAAPGSGSVSLAGGQLAANASCSFQVSVTGVSMGLWNNQTSLLNSNAGSAPRATASLNVLAAPATAVPTLSEWALLLLLSAVGVSAVQRFRRR